MNCICDTPGMDEQGDASIEKNERTLLTDAKPQPEEAIRHENETASTRDSDDKSSDIINKTEVSDKKKVPENFTNGSGTSVDKIPTYSSVTDEKLSETTDKPDTCELEFHKNRFLNSAEEYLSLEKLISSLNLNMQFCTKFGFIEAKVKLLMGSSYIFVAPIMSLLRTLFSKPEASPDQHHTTSRETQITLGEDDRDEESNKSIVGAASQSMELESEKNIVDRIRYGSEELSINNATTSDIQPVQYDNNQFNDNIQRHTGESNQLYVDQDLPNTKTTKITKIKKQSIHKCALDETITRIKKILEMIKDNQSCILEELEFRKSELKMEQLEEFLKETLVCEILKLSIGFTERVSDLIPSFCRIASKYKTSKLSLIFDDLKKEDIDTLLKNLDENDKYTELDISYNRNIESAGYKNVGKIVQKHEVRKLRLADCDISDDDLHKLFDGMGDAKLEYLDISCADNVTAKGFGHIGKQVAQKRIKRLKLSDTQLNEEALNAFYNEFVASVGSIKNSEGQDVWVEEIDVSYNSAMEPEAYKVLGSMVKLFGVKKLSLAGCGLRKKDLEDFREKMNSKDSIKQTGQTKMESLSARDNTCIGEGLVEIAKIVNECQLEELDIRECRFSANELDNFIKALGKAKLKCLYLGEERQFDKNYISQVCNLLPHIEETLRLKGTVRNHPRRMLQEKLDILGKYVLEIKLDDDRTLSAQIQN